MRLVATALPLVLLASCAPPPAPLRPGGAYYVAEETRRPPAKPAPADRTPAPLAKEPALPLSRLRRLPEGSYRLKVSGVLCNACTKAIVENLRRVAGVQSASFSFEEGFLRLTIAKGKWIRMSSVYRAVGRAGRTVKLGTRFKVTELRKEP